jgi:hypothetical protein
MQMQPMWLAVLRELAGLPPFRGLEIDVRPFQVGGLVTSAWNGDEESGEITPNWLV